MARPDRAHRLPRRRRLEQQQLLERRQRHNVGARRVEPAAPARRGQRRLRAPLPLPVHVDQDGVPGGQALQRRRQRGQVPPRRHLRRGGGRHQRLGAREVEGEGVKWAAAARSVKEVLTELQDKRKHIKHEHPIFIRFNQGFNHYKIQVRYKRYS